MTTLMKQEGAVTWLGGALDIEMGQVPQDVAAQAKRFDDALGVLAQFGGEREGTLPRLSRMCCEFGVRGNELVARVPHLPVVVMREVEGRVHFDANHPLLRSAQVEGEGLVLAGLCGLAPDVAVEMISQAPVKHEGRNATYGAEVWVTINGHRIRAALEMRHGNSASDMGLYETSGLMLLQAVVWPGEPAHFVIGGVCTYLD